MNLLTEAATGVIEEARSQPELPDPAPGACQRQPGPGGSRATLNGALPVQGQADVDGEGRRALPGAVAATAQEGQACGAEDPDKGAPAPQPKNTSASR